MRKAASTPIDWFGLPGERSVTAAKRAADPTRPARPAYADPPPIPIRFVRRRAWKPWSCAACMGTIAVGDGEVVVYEGRLQLHLCIACGRSADPDASDEGAELRRIAAGPAPPWRKRRRRRAGRAQRPTEPAK